ncbi:hypothetical protein M433DRAFT_389799 [Acidomyces richmondensis BFW]|nr:hypothetical protein M433DRAFT_389799 [Acidomyces richmondensis BFW]
MYDPVDNLQGSTRWIATCSLPSSTRCSAVLNARSKSQVAEINGLRFRPNRFACYVMQAFKISLAIFSMTGGGYDLD